MKILGSLTLILAIGSPAFAQTARPVEPRQTHYQIGVMERVLEGAVEHGAALIRDRLQAVAPDEPAHARSERSRRAERAHHVEGAARSGGCRFAAGAAASRVAGGAHEGVFNR